MDKNKVKVLHRVSTVSIGGLEKYVAEHYRFMDHSAFCFDFLTRNPDVKEWNAVKELSIQVRLFTATEREDKDKLLREISDILDDGYSAIHMNTNYWVGFLIEELAMQKKIPKVIVHSHNSGIDAVDAEIRKRNIERHEYFKERFGKQYATHFCACSWKAADWLYGSQIPREEIRILKNAIDLDKYLFDPDLRKKLRAELGLNEEFVIGNIGRFTYQKNQKFLIDVLVELLRYNPNTRLILIGRGELESELKNYIRNLGIEKKVIMMDWREDVNRMYQAMDLFALPSHFEGLPIVGIEAQAAGLPTLFSNQITDEVAITDNAKMLPLDKELWISSIKKIMDGSTRKNMEKEMTEAGYNIKYAAKELEKLYLE